MFTSRLEFPRPILFEEQGERGHEGNFHLFTYALIEPNKPARKDRTVLLLRAISNAYSNFSRSNFIDN